MDNYGKVNHIESVIKLVETMDKYFEILPDALSDKDLIYKNFSEAFLPLIAALRITQDDKKYYDLYVGENIVCLEKLKDFTKNEIINKENVFFDELLLKEDISMKSLYSNIIINRTVLDQCIFSYQNNQYNVCIIGLFTIIDGMLSTFFKKKRCVDSKKRVKNIAEKINGLFKDQPDQISNIIYTLPKIIDKINEDSNFNDEEPACINRHWVLHGRSKRKYYEKDCIILFRIIKSLNILYNFMSCKEDNI